MREILFRGQTRRFGEKVKNFAGDPMPSNWVYGGVCCGEGAFSIIYAYMDEEKEIPIEKHVVYTDTIGQYTGLTDKNGKKIFEGDIIKAIQTEYDEDKGNEPITLSLVGEMIFNDACFGLKAKKVIDFYAPMWEEDNVELEVIGNIHDTPELMKGGEGDG